MPADFKFCPRCAAPLMTSDEAGFKRLRCTAPHCGFVHYGNPVPVVAAIVEYQGDIILVRNVGWPEKMYGLVSGFLEAHETPEAGVLREVKEELNLDGTIASWVGAHAFEMRNELLLTWHVRAEGTLKLSAELEGCKAVPPEKLRAWPFGTGLAVEAWLKARSGA